MQANGGVGQCRARPDKHVEGHRHRYPQSILLNDCHSLEACEIIKRLLFNRQTQIGNFGSELFLSTV